MSCIIRLSAEEKKLVEDYAKLHSISLEEAFKRALFDKIEDEHDVVIANAAYNEYVRNGRKADLPVNFGKK